MSSERPTEFTKENIDRYLKEVARQYRKLGGKSMPAELILIGGASVLINYGFREMTVDIDAVIRASSVMKDAINRVGDQYGLPNGWLNDDFKRTKSYTPKLEEFSRYYKTYFGVLSIRTISGEYLIAMKLCSGRLYKRDLSDVLGVLSEHEKRNQPLTIKEIEKAVVDLYGSLDVLSETARTFITEVMKNGHFEELYTGVANSEKEAQELLLDFDRKYPGVTKDSNVGDIIKNLQEKKSRPSVLAKLREEKSKITNTTHKTEVKKQKGQEL